MITPRPSQTQEFEKANCDLDPTFSYVQIPNGDTPQAQQFSKRSRGVVLSCKGLERLQAAIKKAQLKENYGNRFTNEELSLRMKVSNKTLRRLWSLTAGLDQRTLRLCFSAFNLQLTAEDYTTNGSCVYTDPDVKAQLPNFQLVAPCYKYPSGPEPIDSIFYIPRPPIEELAYQEITQPGCFIRIKAATEMGKSSLMCRILAHGQNLSYQTVNLDMNQADASILSNVDKFLRWFCKSVSQQLKLEPKLDDYWDEDMGSKLSCSIYFQAYILDHINSPLVLALNELSKIFEYPELAQEFLPLLRSWHESAQFELAWQKLRLVMIYSTEIFIPLDINHSPCNVGLSLELPEFTSNMVQDLALRHRLNWLGNQTEQLIKMVGGHPSLVRIALYHLCCTDVTLPQLLLTASTESGIYGAHLRRRLTTLQKNPELLNTFKAVFTAEGSISLEPILVYKLESMGLVKMNSDGVTISRELYRNYFHKHLFK